MRRSPWSRTAATNTPKISESAPPTGSEATAYENLTRPAYNVRLRRWRNGLGPGRRGRVRCDPVGPADADALLAGILCGRALIARSIPRMIQRYRSPPSRAGHDHSDTSALRRFVRPRRTDNGSTF